LNSGGILKIIENTMACHKVSYGKSITMYNHHYLPIDQGGASSEMIVVLVSPHFQTTSIYQKPHNAYNVGPSSYKLVYKPQ
jgi:hypothetical protein